MAKESKKVMLARMAKVRKKAHTPAARKKAKATRAATMARKNAEATREFTAHPMSTGAIERGSDAGDGGRMPSTEIPLHAIPARPSKTKLPVKAKAPAVQPFNPSETVQIVAGNFRITVERST